METEQQKKDAARRLQLQGSTLPEVFANSNQRLMGAAPQPGQAPTVAAGAVPFRSDVAEMMRTTRQNDKSIRGVTGIAPVQTPPAVAAPQALTVPAGAIPFASGTAAMFRDTRAADQGIKGVVGQAADQVAVAAPVTEQQPGGAVFGLYPQLAGGKRTTYATDNKLRSGVVATGPSTFEPALTPAPKPIVGGGPGVRLGATQDPRSTIAGVAQQQATLPTEPTAAGVAPGQSVATQEPGSPVDAAQPTPGGAIRRVGNSYSGGPNITGDISLVNGRGDPIDGRGGTITAQDNQAAEDMARRYGQTSGFGPAGALRGGGTVSSIDTSAGHAQNLKELAEIEKVKQAQEANMQAQAGGGVDAQLREAMAAYADPNRKVGTGKALRTRIAALMDMRNQDSQAADRGAIRKMSQDRLGLDTARLGLDSAKAGQDAKGATLDNESKSNLLAAQKALAAAKTPAEKVAAEDNLRALMGKFGKEPPPDQYAYAPGGQTVDPATGQTVTQPGVIFNKMTGQVVQQGQAQAKLPPGMVKQVGTSNGKPVYEDANGKRYQ